MRLKKQLEDMEKNVAELEHEREDQFENSIGSKISLVRSKDSQSPGGAAAGASSSGLVRSMSSGGGDGDHGSPGSRG